MAAMRSAKSIIPRHSALIRFLVLFGVLLAPASHAASQTTYFVDADVNDGGDGLSWGTAYNDLQSALGDAMTGDEIWVAEGTYTPTTDPNDRAAAFQLVNGVGLYGGFAGTETLRSERDFENNVTILSGDLNDDDLPGFVNVTDNCYHVVNGTNTGSATIVDGFTIRGGNVDSGEPPANGIGSAVYISTGSPQFHNCRFENNLTMIVPQELRAGAGAIGLENGADPDFVNCRFIGNHAALAGAVFARPGASARFVDCMFLDNTSDENAGAVTHDETGAGVMAFSRCVFVGNQATGDGGAVTIVGHTSTFVKCDFIDNTAQGQGGAIAAFAANVALVNCRIFGNDAGSNGGGIYNNDSPTHLINCIVGGNVADSVGGGMYNTNADTQITNSTFSGNSSSGAGAIHNATMSDPIIRNSILWNNAGAQITDEMGASTTVAYSNSQGGGFPGTGNIDADPGFLVAASSTWTTDAIYDPATGQTVLTDTSASYPANEHTGRFLKPDASQYTQSLIIANTATTITIWGDFTSLVPTGGPYPSYEITDYRLNSMSPCIDAGDNTAVPADTEDLNNDGNTSEPVPFDLAGNARFYDALAPDTGNGTPPIVDMGAFEFFDDCNGNGVPDADEIEITTIHSGLPLSFPTGVTHDSDTGDFVVIDAGLALFRVTAEGMVTTIASGFPFESPHDVTQDALSGDFIVTDFNPDPNSLSTPQLVRVTSGGQVQIIVGGIPLFYPVGVTQDASTGEFLVTDFWTDVLYRVTTAGEISLIDVTQSLNGPLGVVQDTATGDFIVTSQFDDAIFRVTAAGMVTTIASGSPFMTPSGVTQDAATGDFFVTDVSAGALFRVTPAGIVTTVASGQPFVNPRGITQDASTGDFILVDQGADALFRVRVSGSPDCNADGVLDECQLDGNDCNNNGIPDDCDIADMTSDDMDMNGVPDECTEFVGQDPNQPTLWSFPANWEDNVVPDNDGMDEFSVTIDAAGAPAGVVCDIDAEINTLRLLDNTGLRIGADPPNPSGSLSIVRPGGLRNDGCIVISDGAFLAFGDGAAGDAVFLLGGSGPTTLEGTAAFISSVDPADALHSTGLINGEGVIDATFQNDGVIRGDVPSGVLSIIGTAPNESDGLVEAAGGGVVSISNAIITGAGAYRTDCLGSQLGAFRGGCNPPPPPTASLFENALRGGCNPPPTLRIDTSDITGSVLDVINDGLAEMRGSTDLAITTAVTIDSGGVYTGVAPTDAALITPVLDVLATGGVPGQVILVDQMSITILGGFGGGGGSISLRGAVRPVVTLQDAAVLDIDGNWMVDGAIDFAASSGSTVELAGDLAITSLDPNALDLGTARVLLNGSMQLVEAAGADLGAGAPGFANNFALGTLELASGTLVRLVDDVDNQNDGQGVSPEALYVETLVLNPGSTLTVTTGRLYFDTRMGAGTLITAGDFDADGDVDLGEFAIFAQCFAGALNPPAPSCPLGIDADFDDDGDVDTADFAIFAQNFTGS